MEIRIAELKDKEKVLKLFDDLRNYTSKKPVILTDDESKLINEKYDSTIGRKDIILLVAEEENDLIGMLTVFIIPSIKHGSNRAIIEDVLVSEEYRNKGVGSKLFDKAKKILINKGINVIKLNSDKDYKEAHNFYIKNGGKQTELMFRFDL